MSESIESKAGLLEVVHDDKTQEQVAFCPYRDQMVKAGVCYSCKDCSSLVLSPDARHYYVLCDRAEKDGLWVEGGGDGRPKQVHRCSGSGAELDLLEVVDPAG